MSFGDHTDDPALRAAWQQFCARLQQAGERAFKDHNPASALQRADAFRFLTQNLGQAFDLALETRDTQYPALHAFCHPTRKLGGDAADFVYLQAWIDGHSTYRISGNKGTARFLNFRPMRTAISSSSSAASRELPTGCRPPQAHASCSCARASIAGTSGPHSCASSASACGSPSPCRRRRR
jgi:hypothetical protein